MPSETMELSSYSSEDIWSVTERWAGFWKSGSLSKCYDFDQGVKPSLNAQAISKISDGGEVSIISAHNESSLFSSSLSELFSRKLKLSANDPLYGHAVDTVSPDYEEERLFGSLQELEAQIIGNLLPSDDDLLSGVTDGLDHSIKDGVVDDMDELDLFSSVGGMELGDDDRSSSGHQNSEILGRSCNNQLGLSNASTAGGQPSGTLSMRNINSDVADSEQKEGSLYLHQNSPPLKSPTSFPGLHRATKPRSMDGGKTLGVESATCAAFLETPIRAVSSSVPNTLPSLVRVNSVGNQRGKTESSSPGQNDFDIQAASAFHPHSLPECYDGLANGVHCKSPEVAVNINLKTKDNMQFCQVNSNGRLMEFNECDFKSSGNGSFSLPSHHHKWGNSYQPPGMMWPNSPTYFDGICTVPALQRLHRPPSQIMSTVFPINYQHVPSSAPSWDRRHSYAGESPEAYFFHPRPLGNMRTAHFVDFVPHNIYPHFGGNCFDLQIPLKNLGLHFHNQRGLMFPGRNHMINSFETYKQRARGSRNDGVSNLADKKQFELDIDRIQRGEDNRTTLMIKNIPNKYTSKMLLATIDERHKGTYDFVYLPIDFKNKCNVGYAFINMTDPSLIIPFYQIFNGKRWEKFNSEKVASLAYARIQGKASLVAHFQNSSLMNEDKRCRPILFNTDGPNAGDQVPFPIGVNLRNKPGRARNNTQEDI